MAISRFAVATDGFRKPNTVTGNDWANLTHRGLYATWGYFARRLKEPFRGGLNLLGFSLRPD